MRPFTLAQRAFRPIEVAAGVPDLPEVQPGAVAHTGRHVAGEQPREALAGLVVHPELQVQARGQQLRVVGVMGHAPPLVVGEQPRQRLEIVGIVVLQVEEQHVTEMQVADVRFGQLLRIVAARVRNPGGQQRRHGENRAACAWTGGLKTFPVLDLELRLQLALPVVDLQLEVFRAHTLLEAQRRAALVGAIVGSLAVEERHQLMRADLEVTDVQALHATLSNASTSRGVYR